MHKVLYGMVDGMPGYHTNHTTIRSYYIRHRDMLIEAVGCEVIHSDHGDEVIVGM